MRLRIGGEKRQIRSPHRQNTRQHINGTHHAPPSLVSLLDQIRKGDWVNIERIWVWGRMDGWTDDDHPAMCVCVYVLMPDMEWEIVWRYLWMVPFFPISTSCWADWGRLVG